MADIVIDADTVPSLELILTKYDLWAANLAW